MSQMGVTKMRLERLADERDRTQEKLGDLLQVAEEEKRDLNDFEREQATKYRSRIGELEEEIVVLGDDVERANEARDVSRLVRDDDEPSEAQRRWAQPRSDAPIVYRNYAEYARDQLIVRFPQIAEQAAGPRGDVTAMRTEAQERLQRTLQDTTSTTVAGLVPAAHMAQIMDIIDNSRPVVDSGRSVPLERGSLTYPHITGRPAVELQASEKTEGGTINMDVDLETLTASTYIGGGNLSWQAINWSTPDALQLWFDLAAEAYARQTEEAACDVLEDSAAGTLGTTSGRLGTAGTETFGQWRTAVINGISSIYSTTGGRARTNTLYLSAARFFQLAALGSDEVVQMSAVGNLNVGSMTGTFSGLQVVGSYAFDQDVAIIGDSGALLVGETAGAPVQLRAVEPSIGGMEVGVIGAFAAAVFDVDRFLHLSTHL
jgi:HK97 family phage major capsid protein